MVYAFTPNIAIAFVNKLGFEPENGETDSNPGPSPHQEHFGSLVNG